MSPIKLNIGQFPLVTRVASFCPQGSLEIDNLCVSLGKLNLYANRCCFGFSRQQRVILLLMREQGSEGMQGPCVTQSHSSIFS